MSLKTQSIILFMLSTFVVGPILTALMGGTGLLINFWCTIYIFYKYNLLDAWFE